MTGYSKCTKLAEGKIYAGGTTIARHVVDSVQIACACRTRQRRRYRMVLLRWMAERKPEYESSNFQQDSYT